ncbi:MAG: hypothetical protein DHS20C03_08510 [Minwuia thermotolerans]|nr:MAG: hypothetical protein DHS20C03_08510 [Minwuia thermotolerans]
MTRAAACTITTGKSATVTPISSDGPMAADLLPFVQKRYDGKGHNWWNVPTSGNYSQDCNIGTWMAEAYLAEMRRQPQHWLLATIVREMVRSGAADGHVVGFMDRLSYRLMER